MNNKTEFPLDLIQMSDSTKLRLIDDIIDDVFESGHIDNAGYLYAIICAINNILAFK